MGFRAKILTGILSFGISILTLFPVVANAAGTNQSPVQTTTLSGPAILGQGLFTSPQLPQNGVCYSGSEKAIEKTFNASGSSFSTTNGQDAMGHIAGTNNSNMLTRAIGGLGQAGIAQPLQSAFPTPQCLTGTSTPAPSGNQGNGIFLSGLMRLTAPVVITDSYPEMEAIAVIQYLSFAIAAFLVIYFGITYMMGIQVKTDPFKFGVRMFAAMAAAYFAPYLMQDLLNLNNVLVNNLSKVNWGPQTGGGTRVGVSMVTAMVVYQVISALVGATLVSGGGALILILIVLITCAIYLLKPVIYIMVWWYMRLLKIFILAALGPFFLIMMALPETAHMSKRWIRAFIGETFAQSFLVFGMYLFSLIFSNIKNIDQTLGINFFGDLILVYAMFLTLEELPHLSTEFIGGFGFGNHSLRRAASGVTHALGETASVMQFTAGNLAGMFAGQHAANKAEKTLRQENPNVSKEAIINARKQARGSNYNKMFGNFKNHHRMDGVSVGWNQANSIYDTIQSMKGSPLETKSDPDLLEANQQAVDAYNQGGVVPDQEDRDLAEKAKNASSGELFDKPLKLIEEGRTKEGIKNAEANITNKMLLNNGSATLDEFAKKRFDEKQGQNQTKAQKAFDNIQNLRNNGDLTKEETLRSLASELAELNGVNQIKDPEERAQALNQIYEDLKNNKDLDQYLDTGLKAYAQKQGFDIDANGDLGRMRIGDPSVEKMTNNNLEAMKAMGNNIEENNIKGMAMVNELGNAYAHSNYAATEAGLEAFAKEQGFEEKEISEMLNKDVKAALIKEKKALNQAQGNQARKISDAAQQFSNAETAQAFSEMAAGFLASDVQNLDEYLQQENWNEQQVQTFQSQAGAMQIVQEAKQEIASATKSAEKGVAQAAKSVLHADKQIQTAGESFVKFGENTPAVVSALKSYIQDDNHVSLEGLATSLEKSGITQETQQEVLNNAGLVSFAMQEKQGYQNTIAAISNQVNGNANASLSGKLEQVAQSAAASFVYGNSEATNDVLEATLIANGATASEAKYLMGTGFAQEIMAQKQDVQSEAQNAGTSVGHFLGGLSQEEKQIATKAATSFLGSGKEVTKGALRNALVEGGMSGDKTDYLLDDTNFGEYLIQTKEARTSQINSGASAMVQTANSHLEQIAQKATTAYFEQSGVSSPEAYHETLMNQGATEQEANYAVTTSYAKSVHDGKQQIQSQAQTSEAHVVQNVKEVSGMDMQEMIQQEMPGFIQSDAPATKEGIQSYLESKKTPSEQIQKIIENPSAVETIVQAKQQMQRIEASNQTWNDMRPAIETAMVSEEGVPIAQQAVIYNGNQKTIGDVFQDKHRSFTKDFAAQYAASSLPEENKQAYAEAEKTAKASLGDYMKNENTSYYQNGVQYTKAKAVQAIREETTNAVGVLIKRSLGQITPNEAKKQINPKHVHKDDEHEKENKS